MESNKVVAEALAVSLDKPLPWAIGSFFANPELSMELWTVIAGISGLDDYGGVEWWFSTVGLYGLKVV